MAKSKGKSRSTQVRSKLAIQVGERIRKTRKQEGLSIENFALRCDIHPSYVGHIERGMQNPTLPPWSASARVWESAWRTFSRT